MKRNTDSIGSKPPSRQAELRLRKQADKIRAKIYAIDEAKRKRENQQLIGRCYKFLNSYGGDEEKWWLYARILDLDEQGSPRAITFQKTSMEIYEVKTDRWFSVHEGYITISGKDFALAWTDFLKEVNRINVIP